MVSTERWWRQEGGNPHHEEFATSVESASAPPLSWPSVAGGSRLCSAGVLWRVGHLSTLSLVRHAFSVTCGCIAWQTPLKSVPDL